jgi:hypothetical protein
LAVRVALEDAAEKELGIGVLEKRQGNFRQVLLLSRSAVISAIEYEA